MAGYNGREDFCLKPIRAALDAETFLLNAGSKTSFIVGKGSNSDFVLKNCDVNERHAQFKKTPTGWCLKDISDYRSNVQVNWEVIQKNRDIPLKEGDFISFRENYYLFTNYYVTRYFQIGELSFGGRLLRLYLSDHHYKEAVRVLKENVNYLGHALYSKNVQIKSLGNERVQEITEKNNEMTRLTREYEARLTKLRDDHAKQTNEISLKLKEQTSLIERLKINQRTTKDNTIAYQNAYSQGVRKIADLQDQIKAKQSQIEKMTEDNGKVRQSLDLNKQIEERLRRELEMEKTKNAELSKIKSEFQFYKQHAAAEKTISEGTWAKKETEIKALTLNLKAYEKRHLDDNRILTERARKIEDTQRKYREIEKQLSDSRSEGTKLKEDNDKLKATIVLNEQVEKRLKENLEIERKKRNELEQTRSEQNLISRDFYQHKVKSLEKEIERLNTEMKEKSDQVEALREETSGLKIEIEKRETTRHYFENNLREKNAELDKRRETETRLNQRITTLNNDLKEMETARTKLNRELLDKDNELDKYREKGDEIKSLNTRILKLQTTLKERDDVIDNLTNKQSDTSGVKMAALRESNEERKRLVEENTELFKTKEALKKGILRLQEISDDKEAKADIKLRLKEEEIKEVREERSRGETFYREVKSSLRCSICTEVFRKAVVLNCSHSFCEGCINDWGRAKNVCPTCTCVIEHKFDVLVLNQIAEISNSFKS